jgi:hypothetical protein
LALNANPFIAVQSMALVVVSDDEFNNANFLDGLETFYDSDVAQYLGSTTGPSYDNAVCSPLSVSWHVDRKCQRISAASFDGMCRRMKEDYGMEDDLHPHDSRVLVVPEWSSTQLFDGPAAAAHVKSV